MNEEEFDWCIEQTLTAFEGGKALNMILDDRTLQIWFWIDTQNLLRVYVVYLKKQRQCSPFV